MGNNGEQKFGFFKEPIYETFGGSIYPNCDESLLDFTAEPEYSSFGGPYSYKSRILVKSAEGVFKLSDSCYEKKPGEIDDIDQW